MNLTLRDLLDVPILDIALVVIGSQILLDLAILGLKSLIEELRRRQVRRR